MASVSRFVSQRLKLRVNREKSAVEVPQKRKFLGFTFTGGRSPNRRKIAPESIQRFRSRVRRLTRRNRGISLEQRVDELSRYLRKVEELPVEVGNLQSQVEGQAFHQGNDDCHVRAEVKHRREDENIAQRDPHPILEQPDSHRETCGQDCETAQVEPAALDPLKGMNQAGDYQRKGAQDDGKKVSLSLPWKGIPRGRTLSGVG